jgi:hypothetical protein
LPERQAREAAVTTVWGAMLEPDRTCPGKEEGQVAEVTIGPAENFLASALQVTIMAVL